MNCFHLTPVPRLAALQSSSALVRHAGRFVACAALGALALWVLAWIWSPPAVPPPERDPAEIAAAERLRDVAGRLDAAAPPRLQVDVDYSEGSAAAWWPRGEAPVLAELVAAGVLPPVAERTGPEPVVQRGPDGIGRYGGAWSQVRTTARLDEYVRFYLTGGFLVRWSPQGYPIVPALARAWEHNDDLTVWTFHLRRGVRWSDGHPFTADDLLYWYEQELLDDPTTVPNHRALEVGGQMGRLEKVDTHTVRFVFPVPHALFLERLASWSGSDFVNSPAHYLSRFHPRHGDRALLERLMADWKLSSPHSVYDRIKDYNNPEHPRLWPWIYRTWRATPPQTWVRNPYYWAVDEEGNQLPYLDRIVFEYKTAQMVEVAAANGELTFQHDLSFELYPLLMESRAAGGFELYHWYSSARAPFVVQFNLTRRTEADDPSAALKRDLLNRVEFRRAMSLALDRPTLSRIAWLGLSEPAQLGPGPESGPFYEPEALTAFAQRDLDEAARLLAACGLVRDTPDGLWRFADGTPLNLHLFISGRRVGGDVYQLLVDQWREAGVRVLLRTMPQALFGPMLRAQRHDMAAWAANGEYLPILEPRFYVPMDLWSVYAQPWAFWFMRGGLYGDPRADEPGSSPPPLDHPLRRNMELYDSLMRDPDRDRRHATMREILRISASNVFTVAPGTPPPVLVFVKDGFRNVSRDAVLTWDFHTPGNVNPELFFWDQPADSPGAIAQLRRELVQTTPRPGAADTAPAGVSAGRAIATLVWIAAALGLAMLALRHPFVARRLVVLVPTLAVISIIVFAAVQLPPGDFIDARIQELEEQGGRLQQLKIDELRRMFHLEDSVFVRYLRWSGLYWFSSFRSQDRGLLQGYLGMSMSHEEPVGDVVGDRLMLTFFISLGSVLFTWATALPAGVYSAVRQYSPGDYLLSAVSFVGLSVPGFLLALLLMYASTRYLGVPISGLFSPEYAIQPEWTWGKFVDLLQRIWVPIVVLGIGGTAGLMRIMRANLLDELRRPYVTTARAKGVRPLRLLFKYPVRIALNPFISGIGGLLPYLISGGAIVELVMSLPTVGPALLDALLLQDVYLSGSFLLVLSLLGVIGTLLSDLLLLWLDPRIRMEQGGTR